ncbi:MAG: hypothetical protein JRD87_01380 [Deltaproteobacteria bacterium]|jgi:hypothetical protein|nr:hypothetical protein [Deltaproteobacteria bacterium]MBW2237598.1 hypothetical protein [Deltaproteobacteria bacterium]MBW2571967.1 hypothetical protein [Deltaproteobacteria bacterium]MBW2668535.1 hypothetical protein [Deltaproteobacteria bacterium]
MKKKNDNSSVGTYLKKRPDMNDNELDQKIKNMTDEDLVRVFLAMLDEDKNRAAYLFQYIKEVVNSSATMGREGYQPIAMFTLYARESAEVTEFKFRPARTGSEEVYQKLNLKRLFELVNDAWVQHGNEVFGGITEETRVDMSALNAWAKAVGDQEEKEPG